MSISTVKAVLNGTTYNLTYNSSTGKWEASIPAPAASSYPQEDHKFGVQITATNNAGTSASIDRTDSAFGSVLALRVLEKQQPVITITSPGSGAYITTATPTITFKILDNAIGNNGDSGVNPDSVELKIDGSKVSGVSLVATDGGYTGSYTPSTGLSEGGHTITIDADDFDGNAASQVSCAFKVDTVPPTLNVTSPADGMIVNTESLTVEGVTNDTTSTPVTVAIKLNGTDQGSVTVGSDGSFLKTITLTDGVNTIVITATDSAGKSSTITKTVTLDLSVPVFTSVTLTPNPADAGETLTLTVEVS